MSRNIYPKDYIKEVLIDEINDIVSRHAYLSFILICAGIEYLGICIDDGSKWSDRGKSGNHFKDAIEKLIPSHYKFLKDNLYDYLRCGMTHSQLPGGYSLTEFKNRKDSPFKYEEHLIKNNKVIVVEFFYQDFVSACNKVIRMGFNGSSKMSKPFLKVD